MHTCTISRAPHKQEYAFGSTPSCVHTKWTDHLSEHAHFTWPLPQGFPVLQARLKFRICPSCFNTIFHFLMSPTHILDFNGPVLWITIAEHVCTSKYNATSSDAMFITILALQRPPDQRLDQTFVICYATEAVPGWSNIEIDHVWAEASLEIFTSRANPKHVALWNINGCLWVIQAIGNNMVTTAYRTIHILLERNSQLLTSKTA